MTSQRADFQTYAFYHTLMKCRASKSEGWTFINFEEFVGRLELHVIARQHCRSEPCIIWDH